MDHDLGMGPYRPQMTVSLCAIPGQRAASDQTKRPYQVYVFYFVKDSSLKFLTAKLFVPCYRVLIILYLPDESDLQQQVAALQ